MTITKHVIDTNVLIVASAADKTSTFPEDETPVDSPEFRNEVFAWLKEFELSDRQLVIDYDWKIVGEYMNKMTAQNYGVLVVLARVDQGNYFGCKLSWVNNDSAVIEDAALDPIITDLADRKMVAAVLAGGRRTGGCNLVNACDTDWYDWQAPMEAADVFVHQVIHSWCHPKWQAKQARTA